MPSTIPSFFTFSPNTPARAHQVNTNFSSYRGTVLPIDPNAGQAITDTYDLGTSEHFWDVGYFNSVDLKGSTTTNNATIYVDTSLTAATLKINIGDSISRGVIVNGIHGGTWRGGAVALETTALTSTFLTLGGMSISITSYGGPLLIFPAYSPQASTSSTFGFTTSGGANWDKFELACFAATAGGDAATTTGRVPIMLFRNDVSDTVYARPACFYNCIGTLNAGNWTLWFAARFWTTSSGTWVTQNLEMVVKEIL